MQGLGHLPGILGRIGVTGEFRLQRQFPLDPLQPGGEQRGAGQIGVQVRSADPAFDAHALGVVAANAEAGRAVVHRPDRVRRREKAGHETLVAVDIGGKKKKVSSRACSNWPAM